VREPRIIAISLAFLGASIASAEWANIPTASLAADSDLIVVAELSSHEAVERLDRTYESADLRVRRVIHGRVRAGEILRLQWDNETTIACPRVVHADAVGRTHVWLLKFAAHSTVRADYPGRRIDLTRFAVEGALREIRNHKPLSSHRVVEALAEHLSNVLAELPETDEPVQD